MRPQVWVGRDLRLMAEDADGVELEGRARLRPGRDVELVMPGETGTTTRTVVVWSWRVVHTGTDGPIFRGLCRWT